MRRRRHVTRGARSSVRIALFLSVAIPFGFPLALPIVAITNAWDAGPRFAGQDLLSAYSSSARSPSSSFRSNALIILAAAETMRGVPTIGATPARTLDLIHIDSALAGGGEVQHVRRRRRVNRHQRGNPDEPSRSAHPGRSHRARPQSSSRVVEDRRVVRSSCHQRSPLIDPRRARAPSPGRTARLPEREPWPGCRSSRSSSSTPISSRGCVRHHLNWMRSEREAPT
jgi:hypothetical protein